MNLQNFFARALDAICLAGPCGMTVSEAAAAAAVAVSGTSASPRAAQVRWLHMSLLRIAPMVEVLGPPDGTAVATASERCRMRALGCHTLEHPAITQKAAELLALCGLAAKEGILQSDVHELLQVQFGTGHHYLICLLAFDLVLRYRVRRTPEHGNSGCRAEENSMPQDEGNVPFADSACQSHNPFVTSRIVLLRHAFSSPNEHFVSSNATSDVKLGASSEDGALASSVPDSSRNLDYSDASLSSLYRLTRAVFIYLRRSPSGIASCTDMRRGVVGPDAPKQRRRLLMMVRKRLMRAGLIATEYLPCYDEDGRYRGVHECVRLARNSPTIESGCELVGANERRSSEFAWSYLRSGTAQLPFCRTLGVFKEFEGQFLDTGVVVRRRDGTAPLGRIAQSTRRQRSALRQRLGPRIFLMSPDENIQQVSFMMASGRGESGLSPQELGGLLSCHLRPKHARMLFCIVQQMHPKISVRMTLHGRTKQAVLVVPGDSSGRGVDLAIAPGGASQTRAASGGIDENAEHDSRCRGSTPPDLRDTGSGAEASGPSCDKSVSRINEFRQSVVNCEDDSAKASMSTRRRSKLLLDILSKFQYIRMDKLGRVIGRLEGRKGFRVDRRVTQRILDFVVDQGAAKKVVIDVPRRYRNAKMQDASDDFDANPQRTLVPVLHVVSAECNLSSAALRVQAHVAYRKLLAYLDSKLEATGPSGVPASDEEVEYESSDSDASIPSVAFASVSNAGSRRRKSPPVKVSFDLASRRGCALEYGFLQGFFIRLQMYHLAAFQCLVGYSEGRLFVSHDRSSFAGSGTLGSLKESDIIGGMSLKTFAAVIGVFCDLSPEDLQYFGARVRDLPVGLRMLVVENRQAVEQRMLLIHALSRMDLVKPTPSEWWTLCATGAVKEETAGRPGLLTSEGSFAFRNARCIEDFWTAMKSRVDVHSPEVPVPDRSCCIWSGKFPLPEEFGEEGQVSEAFGAEAAHAFFWTDTSESFVLNLDDEVQIEKTLRRLLALRQRRDSRARGPRGGLLSRPVAKSLFFHVSRSLRTVLAVEKVALYMRKRMTHPSSFAVELRLKSLESGARARGRFGNKRRRLRDGRGSRKRKLSSIPLDVQSTVVGLVCGLRTVVACQEHLGVREIESETEWHAQGILDDDNDDELLKLWDDISSIVGMPVNDCKSLYLDLCSEQSVLALVRTEVEARLSRVRSQADDELEALALEDVPASMTDNEDVGRLTELNMCDTVDKFRDCLAAIEISRPAKRRRGSVSADRRRRSSHAPRMRRRKRVPALRWNVHENGTCSVIEEPGSRSPDSHGASDAALIFPDNACGDSAEHLEFGVFFSPRQDVESGEVPTANASPSEQLSHQDVPASVVVEILRIVLREPSVSFVHDHASDVLRGFRKCVLQYASDLMILLRLARPQVEPDSTRRVLMLRRRGAAVSQSRKMGRFLAAFQGHKRSLVADVLAGKGSVEDSSLGRSGNHGRFRQRILAAMAVAFLQRATNLSLVPVMSQGDCEGTSSEFRQYMRSREDCGGSVKLCPGATIVSPLPGCAVGSLLDAAQQCGPSAVASWERAAEVDALCRRLSSSGRDVVACNAVLNIVFESKNRSITLPDLVAAAKRKGVEGMGLLQAVRRLIKFRLIARIVVSESVPPKFGGVVYMLHETGCQHFAFGQGRRGSGSESQSGRVADERGRPLTAWTSLSGEYDEELCRQMQTLIMTTLVKRPGTSEDVLCDVCDSLSVPKQATRDILWALTVTRRVSRVFFEKRTEACTLFSSVLRGVELTEVDRGCTSFVDGLMISGLSAKVVPHYSVASACVGEFLSAQEVVSICEEGVAVAASQPTEDPCSTRGVEE